MIKIPVFYLIVLQYLDAILIQQTDFIKWNRKPHIFLKQRFSIFLVIFNPEKIVSKPSLIFNKFVSFLNDLLFWQRRGWNVSPWLKHIIFPSWSIKTNENWWVNNRNYIGGLNYIIYSLIYMVVHDVCNNSKHPFVFLSI